MAGHKVEIVPYAEEHGRYIAAHMREADRREIYYLALLDPWRALDVSASKSIAAWAALVDGEPVAAFGVARRTSLDEVASPWLLATDRAERFPLAIAKASRVYFKRMKQAFPLMENYVLAENCKAVSWLRWLGFEMEEPRPGGVFGVPFVRFGMGLDKCA